MKPTISAGDVFFCDRWQMTVYRHHHTNRLRLDVCRTSGYGHSQQPLYFRAYEGHPEFLVWDFPGAIPRRVNAYVKRLARKLDKINQEEGLSGQNQSSP